MEGLGRLLASVTILRPVPFETAAVAASIRNTAGAQITTPPGSRSFRYLAVHIP